MGREMSLSTNLQVDVGVEVYEADEGHDEGDDEPRQVDVVEYVIVVHPHVRRLMTISFDCFCTIKLIKGSGIFRSLELIQLPLVFLSTLMQERELFTYRNIY